MLRFILSYVRLVLWNARQSPQFAAKHMEQLLYSISALFSNPVPLFSFFFQKKLIKLETIRDYLVVCHVSRQKQYHEKDEVGNSFSEQIAVGTGTEQRQHKNTVVEVIDKKQVGMNTAFMKPGIPARQNMIVKLRRQFEAIGQKPDDIVNRLNVFASFHQELVLLFETRRPLDRIFHDLSARMASSTFV